MWKGVRGVVQLAGLAWAGRAESARRRAKTSRSFMQEKSNSDNSDVPESLIHSFELKLMKNEARRVENGRAGGRECELRHPMD